MTKPVIYRPAKSKGVAILLALLLGGIGAHKFYLNQAWQGLAYMLFCWTFIPLILSLFEVLIMLMTPRSKFEKWYS